MFTKRHLLVLAGIAIMFTGCQTSPKEVKKSSIPQEILLFIRENQYEGFFVGIGFSASESQRKNYAHEQISIQLSSKSRGTSVNFYSSNIDQSNIFYIDFAISLSSSTLSSWLKENGISPKAERSEGEWYAVAYDIPESTLKSYPIPIMPVITLFTIEEAVISAAGNVSDRIPNGSKIAIINISASDPSDAEFVIEELSTELVKIARNDEKEYTIVDRRSLDAIRKERDFQLSGDVSDDTIVSIGQFLGADVVITGSITGANEYRRLRVKALDVKTARLLIQTNMKY